MEKGDIQSIERDVRQLLANKISGDMMGLWLLAPEHLRLGTWDLLQRWSNTGTDAVEPRLAMQLVHESALCLRGVRDARTLNQKGFEVLNGLPFIANDQAVHQLLCHHTIAQAEQLQLELGLLRRARGHFKGQVLAIDPHRIRSHSKRQMCLYRDDQNIKPYKTLPTFFCLDADMHQPVCFTLGTSAFSVTQATPRLLRLASAILNPTPQNALVMADSEHYTHALFDHIRQETPFDLLVPMPKTAAALAKIERLPDSIFTPRWAGYATTRQPYTIAQSQTGPQCQYIQRTGERKEDYSYNAFLCSRPREEADDLTQHYPKRWHIEEFFNAYQDLGWHRAGTLNLHIRYAHMSMALLAQAALHQFRQRLGEPYASWAAQHMASSILRGLDGDIRIHKDTLIVTFYNAPHQDRLRLHYENLPAQLEAEKINPRIPWLFNFKLDFQFR